MINNKKDYGIGDLSSYFDILVSEASTSLDIENDLSIVEFAEKVIFNGEAYLHVQQKAVLKSFYNEELTAQEEDILYNWKEFKKTNWVKDRKYRDMILEVGRGGCPYIKDKVISNKGTIFYKDLLNKNSNIEVFSKYKNEILLTNNINVWNKGIHYCLEVETESGRKEIVTEDHPYLVNNKWILSKDLKKGNQVSKVLGLKGFGNKNKIINIKQLSKKNINTIEKLDKESHKHFIISFLSNYKFKLIRNKENKYSFIKYNKLSKDLNECIQRECSKWNIDLKIINNRLILNDQQSINYLLLILDNSYKNESINFKKILIKNRFKDISRISIGRDGIEIIQESVKAIKKVNKKEVLGLELKDTNIIVNSFISHNSKSLMASIISLYEFNNLISLEDPAKYYNLISNDPIAIFLIATTATQVKETLFLKLKGYLRGSNFFRNLESKKKIEVLADQVRCPEKNVAIYAKHTNSDALVGYNLKCLILDEVARFMNKLREDGEIVSLADTLWRNVGKGCLELNSYLYTNIGFLKIIDLYNIYIDEEYSQEYKNKLRVLTYSNDSFKDLVWSKFNIWNNGIKETVEIVTENGYNERVTLNHPFFIYNNQDEQPKWIKAEYINVGDYISLPKYLLEKENSLCINEYKINKKEYDIYIKLIELIPYLFNNFIKVKEFDNKKDNNFFLKKNINPEILKVIKDICNAIEGFTLKEVKLSKYTKVYLNIKKESIGYEIYKNLLNRGYILCQSERFYEEIPKYINTFDNKELRVFLKAYFTNLCSYFNILDPIKISIKLAQETLEGARLLQNNLLRFGIVSKIVEEPYRFKDKQINYNTNILLIQGIQNIEVFLKEIGVSTDDNQEMKIRINRYKEIYPHLIYNSLDLLNFKSLKELDINKKNSINNLRWEKVSSIIYYPSSLTIGLEVINSGLIVNPILSHNTQRFGKDGKRIAISSAWYQGDPIERLREKAENNPNQISFYLKTWDLNKNKNASRESCESDYIDDRKRAELEYEGIRHKSDNGIFSETNLEDISKGFSIIDTEEINIDIGNRKYVGIKINRLEEDNNHPTFIHIDLSLKNDSTGLCITHIDVDDEENWTIVVDGIIKWTPYIDGTGYKRLVSLLNIEDVLMEICNKRNVVRVTFDSWNSASTIQRLHSNGIITEEISSSRSKQKEYYITIRDLVNQGKILLPRDSKYRVQLISELIHLVLKNNGSITHGIYGKDLSDSFVNSCYQIYKRMIETGVISGYKPTIKSLPSNLVNVVKGNSSIYSKPYIHSGRDRFNKLKQNGLI
ncbi:LAGLIDADG family homing endonuclease [Arthrospira platensis SPKY2]